MFCDAERSRGSARCTVLFLVLGVVNACGGRSDLSPLAKDRALRRNFGRVPVSETIPCKAIPFTTDATLPSVLRLEFTPTLSVADIVFVVDNTGSMNDEIAAISASIRNVLAPQIASEIPGARFAVVSFGDFPRLPYGSAVDRPVTLWQSATRNLNAVEAAAQKITITNGGDDPESTVEALYQLATGEGLGPWVPSAACPANQRGLACLDPEAATVFLLFSDALFHNAADGSRAYTADLSPSPHTYAQMLTALRTIDARVLGMFSGLAQDGADLEQLVVDTRTFDAQGAPLFFDIGVQGQRLNTAVVSAVRKLVKENPIDIDIVIDDVKGDALDIKQVIKSVQADEVIPLNQATKEGGVFRNVLPGAKVYFTLNLVNNALEPQGQSQVFPMVVTLRKNGTTPLLIQQVNLVIPGTDGGTVCP